MVAKKGLEYAKVLSVSLQQRAKDIAKAFDETSRVIKALEEVRKDVDATHMAWHEEALLLGSKAGLLPSVPLRCGRQTNKDNTPAEDSITYYRQTLTIPFLDQLIVEMNFRFSSTQRKALALLGLSLVPAMMHELQDWKARAQELADFYQADLPDPESFSVELHCWELKSNNHTGEKPKEPQQTSVCRLCNFSEYQRALENHMHFTCDQLRV